MKKLILISMITSVAMADCSIKLQKLERELGYAKQYGNHHRVMGLQRAIDGVKMHCKGGYYNDNYYENKYKAKIEIDRLDDEVDAKIDKIEDELGRLNDMKHTMSKSEYKAKKNELKARKKQIKNEYKAKKRELKSTYNY